MKNGRVQAKDIDDVAAIVAVVLNCGNRGLPADLWSLAKQSFPELPVKVVLAKLRALKRQGLIEGCGCGCRGDFEATDAGRALITAHFLEIGTFVPDPCRRRTPGVDLPQATSS